MRDSGGFLLRNKPLNNAEDTCSRSETPRSDRNCFPGIVDRCRFLQQRTKAWISVRAHSGRPRLWAGAGMGICSSCNKKARQFPGHVHPMSAAFKR